MNLAAAIVCRKGRTRQRSSLGDFAQRSEGIGSRSRIDSGRFFAFALIASALATLLSVNSTPAQAQAWPTRQPIRVIVPLTAGSAIDIVGRLVFSEISNQIGQTVVIENRAGASQTIGAAAFTRADVAKDTDVKAAKRYQAIHEFVAAAKAKPGGMTYGSGGRGDATHLAAERFRLAAGLEGLYVPFRGAPEVLTEVMAGRLDFYMAPISPAMPLLAGRQLQALAVASATRASALPEIPTTTEAGFRDSEYEFWVGAFAPAATPRLIVDRLNREIIRALESPDVRDRLRDMGASPMPMSAQAFGEQFKREIDVNAGLVKAVGLQTN